MNGDDPKADLYDQARADGLDHQQAITFAESGGRSGTRGVLRGIVAPAVQGLTFGFGDEIVGAARGALSPELSMGEGIAAERGEYDRFRGDHPFISGATEIAAGFATGGGAARALRGIPQAARALKGLTGVRRGAANLAASAAGGATYAAGQAEGAAGERADEAAFGAAVALPIAAAAPVVTRAVGGAVGAVRGGTSRLRGRAAEQVNRALERSGRTLDDVSADIAAAGDKPVSIMDVGGENVRGLGRLVGNIPGEGRETMMRRMYTRAEGQGSRVIDDLEQAFGQEADDVIAVADDIIARRRETAAPLYEAAYEKTVPRSVLGDVLNDPAFQDAYERGVRIAKREGVDLAPASEFLAGKAGTVGEQVIPVQAIDYMKRGLDDAIDSGLRSAQGMGRQEARGLRRTLNEMLERVDNEVPEFAQARAAYAGETAMLEALDEGRRVTRMRPAEIRKAIEGLTESEADMFRRGALEELRHRVSRTNDTSDAVRRIFGDSEMRGRLAELFPDEAAFTEFARRMGTESEMQLSKNIVGSGSRTAPMQMEAMDFAGSNLAMATQGKLGFIRAVGNWLREKVWEKTAGEVADILSAGAGEGSAIEAVGRVARPDRVQDVLDELAQAAERSSRSRTRAGVGGAVLGAQAARGATGGMQGAESSMSDADLWDLKVSEGMSPDEATRYVQQRRR